MKTTGIKRLQQLVLEDMLPDKAPMSNVEIEAWMGQLSEICKELLGMMSNAVFSLLKGKLLKRYLRQIRKECTLMLDALHAYPGYTGEMEKLQERVSNCLLTILRHMQLYYGKHLDASAAMPVVLYHEAAQKIEQNAALLVTAMTRYNADKRLQAVVMCKMTLLLKQGTGSWHEVAYLQKMQTGIMELCTGTITNITDRLRVLLLQVNFNTAGFIAYSKSRFDEEMADCYELPDQYNCILRYQQEVNLLQHQQNALRYDLRQPGIGEKLLKYVNWELRMLNARYKVSSVQKTAPVSELPYRLPVLMTVNVLAYFFRLLFTVGVVSGHKSNMLLFIARNFSTPGTEEQPLSLKSVENKYKQVVEKTAMTVRSVLLKMLNLLDDEFSRHHMHGRAH